MAAPGNGVQPVITGMMSASVRPALFPRGLRLARVLFVEPGGGVVTRDVHAGAHVRGNAAVIVPPDPAE